jgi:hypothetical protein
MSSIPTLGPPWRRTEFTYTGDTQTGVALHFDTSNPYIPASLFQAILETFRGQTIPGGFCMTSPTRGGLGEWVQQNSNLTPRHASHIAAILVHEKIINSSLRGNSVYLHF